MAHARKAQGAGYSQNINVKVKSDGRQREECLDILGYDAKEFALNAGQSYISDGPLCCSVADGLKRGKMGGRESSQNTNATVRWKDDEGLNWVRQKIFFIHL